MKPNKKARLNYAGPFLPNKLFNLWFDLRFNFRIGCVPKRLKRKLLSKEICSRWNYSWEKKIWKFKFSIIFTVVLSFQQQQVFDLWYLKKNWCLKNEDAWIPNHSPMSQGFLVFAFKNWIIIEFLLYSLPISNLTIYFLFFLSH